MNKFIIIFHALLLLLFTSCQVNYQVNFKSDGNVTVIHTYKFHSKKELKRKYPGKKKELKKYDGLTAPSIQPDTKLWDSLCTRPYIENYSCETSDEFDFQSKFVISQIDSLGYFLNPVHKYLNPEFSITENELVINCQPGNPSHHWASDTYFIDINFEIILPKPILNKEINNSQIRSTFSGHNLIITAKLSDLFFAQETTTLRVTF